MNDSGKQSSRRPSDAQTESNFSHMSAYGGVAARFTAVIAVVLASNSCPFYGTALLGYPQATCNKIPGNLTQQPLCIGADFPRCAPFFFGRQHILKACDIKS
jgi:hypothetical protein